MSPKSFSVIINNKINSFNKKITVDSDKSISIRGFLIGSISENISSVNNVLESEDVFSTIKCLRKLNVSIKKVKSKNYLISGNGIGSLIAKKNTELNFGNSGTLARLLIGILSTTPNLIIQFKGDHSLNKRSMKNLIKLLSNFGATFLPKKKTSFPLTMISSNAPVGIKYDAGVSAQLKSAVILAGLNSYGLTKINEEEKSRDHTENMLKQNSKVIKIKKGKKKIIKVFGRKKLKAINIQVPGDPSSAAFFTALTLLNKKSNLKIKNVGLNNTRIGFYDLLKKQGAKIRFINTKKKNNELIGDILVKSCKLKPINASSKYYVKTTDEYPILFIMAGLIDGKSVFKGIEDLTNKESNRIQEMRNILNQIGIKSSYVKNNLTIYGQGLINATNKKVYVPNLGDHRICMSAFILALLTGAQTYIKNFETVFTSSPSFLKIMKNNLGAEFEIKK